MTKKISLTDTDYASKWCLTDFYPESEKALRDALASGEDFETRFGCRKAISYARIVKDAPYVSVEVTAQMDDLYSDLIYDALYDCTVSEADITDDVMADILDDVRGNGLTDTTTLYSLLLCDPTFDEVCSALDRLETLANNANDDTYEELCKIVASHIRALNYGG